MSARSRLRSTDLFCFQFANQRLILLLVCLFVVVHFFFTSNGSTSNLDYDWHKSNIRFVCLTSYSLTLIYAQIIKCCIDRNRCCDYWMRFFYSSFQNSYESEWEHTFDLIGFEVRLIVTCTSLIYKMMIVMHILEMRRNSTNKMEMRRKKKMRTKSRIHTLVQHEHLTSVVSIE